MQWHGTIAPAPNFNPEADAEVLRKAMKGFGTDEKAIIEVVGNRTSEELKAVELSFKTMYGKDLMKDLKSEMSGHLVETILARFKLRPEYDAWCIHRALEVAFSFCLFFLPFSFLSAPCNFLSFLLPRVPSPMSTASLRP